MAKIVLGAAMSHSPMMAMHGSNWKKFAESDRTHPMLYDFEGNKVTFSELEAKVQRKYQDESRDEVLLAQYRQMRQAYDRLHEDFKQTKPDVVIVVGNDHLKEFLPPWNIPALAVFYGEKVISQKIVVPKEFDFKPEVVEEMCVGMGMDDHHVWPGSPEVGLHLIHSLIEQHFDVGALKELEDLSQGGHGHGYGMVVTEMMRDHLVPMVPIYLNIFPPNVLTPSRSYDLGIALRKAIDTLPDDLRVGLICTGGLSHFVTDRELDEVVLKALKEKDEHTLRHLPVHRLQAGNSEIRNWVVLSAALHDMSISWSEYIPVYRTPAGTGIGMGFARWE